MSFESITEADVVTSCRGVSVRVEVTNTGGRVGSCPWALRTSSERNENRERKSKTTFMENLLHPRKGLLRQSDRSPDSSFKPTRRAFPPTIACRFRCLDLAENRLWPRGNS